MTIQNDEQPSTGFIPRQIGGFGTSVGTGNRLPDSGLRATFDPEGKLAVREADPGKPALEGISPYLDLALGNLMAKAQVKYAEAGGYRNWEKGMPVMRAVAAIKRHLVAFLLRDESEDHLAAMAWNIMVLIHYRDAGTTSGAGFESLDDRPRWSQGPGK